MMNPPLSRRPLGMICALALMALTSVAHAQWKWRDADGRTQYSDRPPPPSVAEKDILQRPYNAARAAPSTGQPAPGSASAAASAPTAPARAASEASSREKVERELKAQEDKARADAMAEDCRQAQNKLRLLESNVRMRSGSQTGESQVMTEQMRQDQMRQGQAVVAATCK
ncbi:DUF4124 domain-containing protein [Mitsuaria sp. 7]|uniref:DUF4124 domain-containing protein n=1 Tax=Mitsuaria sp. 7 TaxID=1658665 RepID=UPI0009EEEE01|nr:DUF4124 domain-containing protein [Mitsuaria sp. 7]